MTRQWPAPASASPPTDVSSSTPTTPWSLADADSRKDVYEWEPQGTGNCTPESPAFFDLSAACVSLISSGSGQFASSLLGVGSSGTDAYFFTRAAMTPQVENGPLVKIYDARELGGFPYVPPKPECKASDECHGAGTPVPPPPTINSKAGSWRQPRLRSTASLQARVREEARQMRAKAPRAKAPPPWRSTMRIARLDHRHRAPLRSAICAAMTLLVLGISAAPASASEPITSFETVSSTSKAGAHPDFTTSFSLQKPGEPESAKNVTLRVAPGHLRQYQRDSPVQCGRLRPG